MDPFINNRKELVPTKPKEQSAVLPHSEENLGGKIMEQLPKGTELTVQQKGVLNKYMDGMRWGITGVSPLTCKDAECPYYSKCPLVKAEIPRPVGEDCPVEKGLMLQWLEQYIATSGMDLERLSAYDMLILQDIAYQQLLEARAAMELADNPLIQVKTFVGVDHRDGSPMYTYSLNNLVTFRERSNKIKMKLLREIIATAKSKSEEERGQSDKSTEIALKLKEIEKKLGKSGIKMPQVIDVPSKE